MKDTKKKEKKRTRAPDISKDNNVEKHSRTTVNVYTKSYLEAARSKLPVTRTQNKEQLHNESRRKDSVKRMETLTKKQKPNEGFKEPPRWEKKAEHKPTKEEKGRNRTKKKATHGEKELAPF